MSRGPSPIAEFFTGTSPIEVLRALRELERVSSGEVTSPRFFQGRSQLPAADGVLSQAIFGSDADAQRTRWGHLTSPVPLFHPACLAALAELAELPEEAVKRLANERGDAEPGGVTLEQLEQRLAGAKGPLADSLRRDGFTATNLLIRLVPVEPLAFRPSAQTTEGFTLQHPRSYASSRLAWEFQRCRRLMELEAPPIILRHEVGRLRETFLNLLAPPFPGTAWTRERDTPSTTNLPASVPPRDPGAWMEPPDPLRPIGAAFVSEDRILLQYPYVAVLLSRSGEVLDVIETPNCRLVGVEHGGRFALFHRQGFHVRNLESGSWEGAVPALFPAVIVSEEQETACLRDERNARQIRPLELGGYPEFWAGSPDGRFIWMEDPEGSGGVYDTRSGTCVLDSEAWAGTTLPPLLGADGQVDGGNEGEAPEYPMTRALVLTANGFLRVDGRGLWSNDKLLLRLALPSPVVAFSHDGELLLAARRSHCTIVQIGFGYPCENVPLEKVAARVRDCAARALAE